MLSTKLTIRGRRIKPVNWRIIMKDSLKKRYFIDLISEKHKILRKQLTEKREQTGKESLSDNEGHMIAMIEIKKMTIAECGRIMNVSRQAAHKSAKKLSEMGYIELISSDENKKDKLIILTAKGVEYCNDLSELKEEMEKEIIKILGEDVVKLIREVFIKEWK